MTRRPSMAELNAEIESRLAEDPRGFIIDVLAGRVTRLSAYPDGPDAWVITRAINDEGFARMVSKGVTSLLGSGRLGRLGAEAGPFENRFWERLFRVARELPSNATFSEALAGTADTARRTLVVMREGRSCDPYRQYLLAAASHQIDERLADVWWEICGLNDDTPTDYLAVALQGIQGMPSALGSRPEQAATRLVRALSLCQSGLESRANAGELSMSKARMEFLSLARPCLSRFEAPTVASLVRSQLSEISEVGVSWWRKIFPTVNGSTGAPTRRAGVGAPASWSKSASILSRSLAGQIQPLEEASRLIADQERYFAATGDSRPLSLTLTNFARATQRSNVDASLRWASRAVEIAPWDHYTWSVQCGSLLAARRYSEAIAPALEGARRFPHISTMSNQVGHVLMRNRFLREAEAAYGESILLFPEDPHSWGGLAEVAKHDHDLAAAERAYRLGLEVFPENDVLMTGLAGTLRLLGKDQYERDQLLASALRQNPQNQSARAELNRPWTPGGQVADEVGPPTRRSLEVPQFGKELVALTYGSSLRRWSSYTSGETRRQLLLSAHGALLQVENDAPLAIHRCEENLLSLAVGNLEPKLNLQVLQLADENPGYLKAQWAVLRTSEGKTSDELLRVAANVAVARIKNIGAATLDLLTVERKRQLDGTANPSWEGSEPSGSGFDDSGFKSWWRDRVSQAATASQTSSITRDIRLDALEEILINRASMALAA